ncbi:unnamed protein product [Effrenium voratum]|nr:unnamed protein product [Effrenium voratum]
MPAVLVLDNVRQDLVKGRKSWRIEHVAEIESLRDVLWSITPSTVHVSCEILSNIQIVEPGDKWDLFWKVWGNVKFQEDLQSTKQRMVERLSLYAAAAIEKSKQMGFRSDKNKGALHFNALHLYAHAHGQLCTPHSSTPGRDNCITNTLEVGNVLLSEGVSPAIPLYLATSLSKDELEQWREESKASVLVDNLFDAYTLVSRDMLAEEILREWTPRLKHHKMFWPAVSFLLSMDAQMFIGHSISQFSGFLMQIRWRGRQPIIHYNSGTVRSVRLQETKQLASKENLGIPLFGKQIKWIFCIQPGRGDSSSHMAKVAIKSALAKTSLVPVGITTASPRSKFAADLVSAGVRLIYHTPSWMPHINSTIQRWTGAKHRFGRLKKPSHLLSDLDAMVGTFLRIDIPILGLLDPFLFYADIDILFQNDVTWPKLLGVEEDIFQEIRHLPYEQQQFAKPGKPGLPRYFAMSAESEMKREAVNAGVMLWNLQSMRESYPSFLDFIVKSDDITWPIGPGDQGALRTFYKRDRAPSYLPYEFNWKAYWPPNPEAILVHFHGPKCEHDILPYLKDGHINVSLFKFLLIRCGQDGDCSKLCNLYMQYLHA